jgi:hypothetical protein
MELATIAKNIRHHLIKEMIVEKIGEEAYEHALHQFDAFEPKWGHKHAFKAAMEDGEGLDDKIERAILYRLASSREIPLNMVDEIQAADLEVFDAMCTQMMQTNSSVGRIRLQAGEIDGDRKAGEVHDEIKLELEAHLQQYDIHAAIEQALQDNIAIATASTEMALERVTTR